MLTRWSSFLPTLAPSRPLQGSSFTSDCGIGDQSDPIPAHNHRACWTDATGGLKMAEGAREPPPPARPPRAFPLSASPPRLPKTTSPSQCAHDSTTHQPYSLPYSRQRDPGPLPTTSSRPPRRHVRRGRPQHRRAPGPGDPRPRRRHCRHLPPMPFLVPQPLVPSGFRN